MPGPVDFSPPMLTGGVWLEGDFFRNAAGYYPGRLEAEHPGQGARLLTADRTHAVQHFWTGGDAPVNLSPIATRLDFQLVQQSDLDRFEEAAARGDVRRLWFDFWITDQWYLPGAAAGQVLFRTSRRLPYGSTIPGVTIGGDRAPVATLEDASRVKTVQTVVQATPAAGQVKVPDATGISDVEVPSGLTESWLLLRYPAIFDVVVLDLSVSWRGVNDLRVSVDVEEVLVGNYTAAA